MDKAMQTMIDNLLKNTGKSIDDWVLLINEKNIAKHGEAVNFLKTSYGLGHGYANLIVHTSRNPATEMNQDKEPSVKDQYKGKEHLFPIYTKLMESILQFGGDIEVAPKKTYVSLRRKKQFAILQPATKSRFEIGINLKGEKATGILEAIPGANTMCSHRMNLSVIEDINSEVLAWIRKAYDNAG